MASSATEWAWRESRASNGSLIVLLAIADEIDAKGNCIMSTTELAQKTRLSDRAVRNAVGDLTRAGDLVALSGGSGRGNRTAYAMPGNLADTATFEPETRQDLPPFNPAESATFSGGSPEEPQVSAISAKSATFAISDDLDLDSVVSGRRSKPSTSEPARDDVERLCQHLAERVIANGSRKPVIGKKWRDAARLLMDNDGISEERIHLAIDWSQQDDFWHKVVLSMPTLRKQFDKLRLAALAEQRKKSQLQRNGHQPTNDDYEALLNNWARPLDAMETGNDPRGNDRPGEVHRPRLPAAEDATGDGDRLV